MLWYEQVATYDFQVATSYYGYDETERHFGLGSRTTVDVVVEFPSGHVTRINNVAANQTISVLEAATSPPALPGDYNQSAQVDAADYILWRNSLGTNVTPFTGADGNGNGTVDQADYNVWRANYGTAIPSVAAGRNSDAAISETLPSVTSTRVDAPSLDERDIALANFNWLRMQLQPLDTPPKHHTHHRLYFVPSV